MMKRILVTGFEPFGSFTTNASWEVARRIPAKIRGFEITTLQLPVTFESAASMAIKAASALQPEYVLSIGQAAGRAAITPEYVAINLRHATIPDNNGYQPYEAPVTAGGPDAYFSSVPVFKIKDAISAGGTKATVSYSAGTFVCNDLFYQLLHYFHGSGTGVGFIHVPLLQEQASEGQFFVKLDDAVSAIVNAIIALQ